MIRKNLFLILLFILWLQNCKQDDYVFPPFLIPLIDTNAVTESRLEDLTQESNANYDLNVNGLVTRETLIRFWNDWNGNRPASVSGKLILLHLSETTLNGSYIRPKEISGVYSYAIANVESNFREPRFTGVITVPHLLPSGNKIQNLINEYGINPNEDLIVIIPSGTATEKLLSLSFRVWHVLRYWGVDSKNLAVLNGGSSDLSFPSNMINNFLSDRKPGSFRLRSLKRDNTVLQVTVQDLLTLQRSSQLFGTSTKVNIIDSRTAIEFNVDRSQAWYESNARATPWTGSEPQKYIAMEGRINQSINMPISDFVESNGPGFKLKDFSSLKSLALNKFPSLQQGAERFIVYSRLGVRASLSGFVFQSILGYPTTYYDGGFAEWGIYTGRASESTNSLPFDSPWRTDRSELTLPNSPFAYNVDEVDLNVTDIQKFTILFSEAFAKGTDEAKKADKSFIKNQDSGSSGPLPSRPGNPCG